MKHHSVIGFLIILTIYTVALLAWLVYDGRAAIDVVQFYILGAPVVALAFWWGNQAGQRRR
jgi:hypothetical protein